MTGRLPPAAGAPQGVLLALRGLSSREVGQCSSGRPSLTGTSSLASLRAGAPLPPAAARNTNRARYVDVG